MPQQHSKRELVEPGHAAGDPASVCLMVLQPGSNDSTPSAVALAAYALRGLSKRPQPTDGISLLTAIGELAAWLADEHQAANAFAPHWASLVDDVRTAMAACGPRLAAFIVAEHGELDNELAGVRKQLRELRDRDAPDRALLRRLGRIVDHVTATSATSPARLAALDDLLDGSSTDDLGLAEERARVLADLGPGAGWPASEFAVRVARALEGDAAIENAIGVAGRVESRADRIVWLRYHVARLGDEHAMTIGAHVTLLDGDWVASALEETNPELEGIAPEITAAAGESQPISVRDRVRGVALRRGDGESDQDPPPFVMARIKVPDVRHGEALDRALHTAKTLAALGVLYGSDPGVWTVDPSTYAVYSEGRHASSVGADADARLPAYAALALQRDRTAEVLLDLADSLGPHLPVRDPGVAETATLAHWLQDAQLTAAPPRLLLCDRVIEQVRGWAGVGDLRRFVNADLRLPIVRRRMLAQIHTAAWQSLEDLTHGATMTDAASLFVIGESGHRQRVHIPRFLASLDQIAVAVDETPFLRNPALPLRLAALQQRTRTKAARREWLRTLMTTFDRAEARRRRTRNSLVHGGPLCVGTIDAVVRFAEELAFHALGESIEGRLTGTDLVDHFLSRREDYAAMQRAIDEGHPLGQALFTDDV